MALDTRARIAALLAHNLNIPVAPTAAASNNKKKDEQEDEEEDEEKKPRYYPFPLTDKMANLVNSERFSDVHFVVGANGTRIAAHKAILAARSPVFAALLFSQFAEAQSKEDIPIPDIEAEAFLVMLRAMYTDEVELTPDTAVPALFAAKKYQVEVLRKACVDYMSKDITPQNAAAMLNNTSNMFEEEQFALKYIEDNATDVLKTKGFLELSENNILALVQSEAINCSEVDLFRAVHEWSLEECIRRQLDPVQENRVAVLKPIVPYIRFPLMDMADLVTLVQPTGVLSTTVLLELYKYVGSKDSELESKKNVWWFCKSCTLRNAPEATKCTACGGTEKRFATRAWTCGRCTLQNDSMSAFCSACGSTEQVFQEEKHSFPFSTKERTPRRPYEWMGFDKKNRHNAIEVLKGGKEVVCNNQNQWSTIAHDYTFVKGDKNVYVWEYTLESYDTQNSYNVVMSLATDLSTFSKRNYKNMTRKTSKAKTTDDLPNNNQRSLSSLMNASLGRRARFGRPLVTQSGSSTSHFSSFNSIVGYSNNPGYAYYTGNGYVSNNSNPTPNNQFPLSPCQQGDRITCIMDCKRKAWAILRNGKQVALFTNVKLPCMPVLGLILNQTVKLSFPRNTNKLKYTVK